MATDVGFVLLTHSQPQQILRLVGRLNAMFDRPAIVGHHDFSKCALPLDAFTPNVSFVRPHEETGWGKFSVIEAIMRAIRQLHESPQSPEWMVLLSGSDYPIKPAARIVADLQTGGFDAHIEHRLIQAGRLDSAFQRTCFERYCVKRLWVPWVKGKLRPCKRQVELRAAWLTRRLLPFTPALPCFAGSLWFCLNRRAMAHLLKVHSPDSPLGRHYRTVQYCDESYFQCLLANASQLKLHNENFRYIDWSAGHFHPKTLGRDDLPRLMAAPQHFARKFAVDGDAEILNELDAINSK